MISYIQALERINMTDLYEASNMICETTKRGGRIFVAGNGGSYSIAHHFANDLLWGEKHPEPEARNVIALGGNISALTALANDVSYECIFLYEAQWHGMNENDLVVVFSVSGRSKNIQYLLTEARKRNTKSVVFVGQTMPIGFCQFLDTKKHDPFIYVHNSYSPVEGSLIISIDSSVDKDSIGYFGIVEGVFSCCCHVVALGYHNAMENGG